tara:strand:- start:501 stop:1253 length:753 start_codon:yes stop_codon:yes gene_type:complete
MGDLESLMKKSGLWRASSIDCEFRQGLPSGFPLLDNHLPGSGWPVDGVTELLHDQYGIGELRLLSPALARLSQEQSRRILLVSPPFIPYPPALQACGVDLSTLLIVQPKSDQDILWVLEQALGSKSCSAVLAWPQTILDKQIRRLQIASKEGNTWNILFRKTNVRSSPAELRIHLSAGNAPLSFHSAINVKILKRRGGWESTTFRVDFDDNLNQQTPDFSELFVNPPVNNNETKILQRPVALPSFPATAG